MTKTHRYRTLHAGSALRSLSIVLICLFVGAAVGCSFGKSSSSSSSSAFPQSRLFYASKVDGSGETYSLTADLHGISNYAAVYVERGADDAAVYAQAIANEFDARIYNTVRNNYATESDVDGNGKVILLLLDIVDGFTGTGGYVGGYFHPYHLFDATESNRADMIFLDVDPVVPGSDGFFRTASHEFQHLVNFVENELRQGKSQDTWINEGLSLSSEYLSMGTHSQNRIAYYNYTDDGPYPGFVNTIRDGNNFFVWDGPEGDVLADYATAYIFFQWLRIHASNGAAIYHDILASEYGDHSAISAVASSRIYGGAATTFPQIIRDWYLALYYRDAASVDGPYGFNGDPVLNTLVPRDTSASGSTGLLPGEGVFDATPDPFNPTGAGSSIGYVGLSAGSDSLDLDGSGGYTGGNVLAWNGDTDIGGASQAVDIGSASIEFNPPVVSGDLLVGAPGGGITGSSATVTATPEIYPIGARGLDRYSPRVVRDDE